MYAAFVAAAWAALWWGAGDDSARAEPLLMTVGGNAAYKKSELGKSGLVTLEYRPSEALPWGPGLRPMAALGASPDGTLFGVVGVHRAIRFRGLTLVPTFGPALMLPHGRADSPSLLQFRTSIELQSASNERFALAGGFYHLSNAELSSRSAAIDVFFVSARWSF